MIYKAFAIRTKTDHKRVLVQESTRPIDRSMLKQLLTARSLEFDETTVIDIEQTPTEVREIYDGDGFPNVL